MSDDQKPRQTRPDLDESISVPEVHAALKKAETPAVGREKRLQENGMESVSLWLLLISGLVVLAAGAVIGKGGSFLDYGELVKTGYQRGQSPVAEVTILPPQPALALFRREGLKSYSSCSACHQPSGAGNAGGGIPPLVGSDWVTGNTERLAMIIWHGVQGPIEVKGVNYNGAMPAQGPFSAIQLASLMTYIRTSWGNDASIVTPEMAEVALEIAKKRSSGGFTVAELQKDHDKMLPGEPIDPNLLLDPETFEPVGSAAE